MHLPPIWTQGLPREENNLSSLLEIYNIVLKSLSVLLRQLYCVMPISMLQSVLFMD